MAAHVISVNGIDGLSTYKIAKRYNCSATAITKVVRMEGIIRTPGEANAQYSKYHSKWIELYKSGSNASEIANIYGCGIETVSGVIRKAGITRSRSEVRDKYGKYHTEWIDYMYSDATIYLERKKGKAAEILLLYSDGARPMSNDVKDNEQLIM